MKKILATILLSFLAYNIHAQLENESNYELALKKSQKEIRIKIFPKSLEAFESYRFQGMQCEINAGTSPTRKVTVKPASTSDWNAKSTSNKKAAAAYEMLTKENAIGSPTTLEEKVKADKLLKYSHGFYLVLTTMDPEVSMLSGMEIKIPMTNEEITLTVSSTQNPDLTESFNIVANRIIYEEKSPEIFGFSEDHAARIAWDHEDYFSQVVSYMIQEKNNKGEFIDMDMPNKIYTTQEQDDPKLKYKMSHLDSLDQNYIDHTYRLVGIDAFGDRMNPSESITIAGKDLTPPKIPENFEVKYSNGTATLIWGIPADDIDRLLVLRSENGEEGPYEQRHEDFLGNKSQEFIDKVDDPEKVYFYLLLAADSAGNVAKSYPQYLDVPDDFPPNVPLDVTANVDSLGKVILYWHHNGNKDLRGYKVFKAENDKQEFLQVSDGAIKNNVFHDQLNLKKHNPEVRYYVKALDMSYNHSISSDTITVLRPDTIAPTPPILRRAVVANSKVNLAWIPSSSLDVKYYIVMADTGSGYWEQSRCLGDTNRISVPLLADKKVITYKITAEDEVGNKSQDEAAKRVFISDSPENILDFELANTDGNISISWGEITASKSIMIYRSRDGENFSMLRKVNGNITSITDKNVIKGKKYQYKLLKENINGTRSGMSVAQEIKVK